MIKMDGMGRFCEYLCLENDPRSLYSRYLWGKSSLRLWTVKVWRFLGLHRWLVGIVCAPFARL